MKFISSLLILLFVNLLHFQALQAQPTVVDYNPSCHTTLIQDMWPEVFLIMPGEELIQKGVASREVIENHIKTSLEKIPNVYTTKNRGGKVLVDGKNIMGYAFYHASKEESIADCTHGCNEKQIRKTLEYRIDVKRDGEEVREYVELGLFFIKPEYRNKGLGKILLNAVFNTAQNTFNIKLVKLATLASNSGARHFFEKNGFIVSKRPLNPQCLEMNMISYEKYKTN